MKDIDFDELDRAVNSLMSTTSQTEEPETADDAPTALLEESTTPDQEDDHSQQESAVPTPALDLDGAISSEDDLLQTHAPETATEEPEKTAVPAARRGRFMDVVRPMARDTKKRNLPGVSSRQGITLQPMTTSVHREETAAGSEAPVERYDAVEDSAKDATSSFAFGADLESTSKEDTPGYEPVDDLSPLSSPFLPDAKVEKRPLGRPASPALDEPVAEPTGEEAADEPILEPLSTTDYPAEPTRDAQLPEQPLPPELGSELLSIETSADNLPVDTPTVVSHEIKQAPVPKSIEPTPAPVPTPMGTATSIPQQYKIEPRQEDEAPANAIYDAQPLAHPVKKTPGWVWIVGIVAVLLLGVGGGAAIYYLGLL